MDGAVGFDISVAERIRAIVAEQAGLDMAEVTPEARLADLGLDSLGVVEILFAVEETFDVSVPFNANDAAEGRIDLSTVGALIAGVEGLIAA